jgi:hypothetical protein
LAGAVQLRLIRFFKPFATRLVGSPGGVGFADGIAVAVFEYALDPTVFMALTAYT